MDPINDNIDDIQTHRCRICTYSSTHLQDYMNHITMHAFESKVILSQATFYKCDECQCAFLTDKALKLHKVAHVVMAVKLQQKKLDEMRYRVDEKYVKRFSCSECDLKFVLESTLQMHMAVHKPFKFVCSCGIGYYKSKDLRGHIRLVHDKPTHNKNNAKHSGTAKDEEKSEIGGNIVTKKKKQKQQKTSKGINLKIKMGKIDKEIEMISCNLCNKKCNLLKMKIHAQEMHADVPWSCKYCYLRFKTTKLLMEHKNTHRNISCDVCGKKLMTSASLYTHSRLHDSNPRPYTCSICSKTFTQRAALNNHLKRHNGTRDFECKYCTKTFFEKNALQIHERTHTGHKPYTCEHCNKPFSDQSAHKRHVRIHTKEYRYFCTECPQKFTDASSMIRHRLKHSSKQDNLKFKCDICEKSFHSISSLKLHILLHLDRKQFECNDCGAKFVAKPFLYDHIQRHHAQRYECPYCGKKLFNQELLKKHKMKFHPIALYCSTCPKVFGNEQRFQAHRHLCCQKKSQKG